MPVARSAQHVAASLGQREPVAKQSVELVRLEAPAACDQMGLI